MLPLQQIPAILSPRGGTAAGQRRLALCEHAPLLPPPTQRVGLNNSMLSHSLL